MITHRQKQISCIAAVVFFILAIILLPFYPSEIAIAFCGIVIILFFIEKIYKKSGFFD